VLNLVTVVAQLVRELEARRGSVWLATSCGTTPATAAASDRSETLFQRVLTEGPRFK
jgi:hypothetical protein